MNGDEWREKACRQAESWLGRREADGSHREIIEVYNSIRPLPRAYRMSLSDPWCAAFVSAVGKACGLEDILFPECACDPMIALYKAAGRWMENDAYVPKPGDVIFYDWQDSGSGDNRGSSDHVGIVVGVDKGRIAIIEGNCSDRVMRTSRQVDGPFIRGYGLPDYEAKAEKETSGQQVAGSGAETPAVLVIPEENGERPGSGKETAPVRTSCSLTLPLLRMGAKSEAVRAAQFLLQGRGFACGPEGADGEFGPNTLAAVLRFQRRRGLEEDGVIGEKTYGKLWFT